MWNIHYTKGENRKEVALEHQSCGMASTLHMSAAWTHASEWNMWKRCGFFLWNLGKHRRWLARRRSQIDHAQESVTPIFSQYWIKLFVKLGRWYSTGLKFLYQRTFNSRINKSFSHTTLKRPLSSSTHGDSTVLIIITLSDKEIRQVLCRKDKSKWMFDVQICTQFILRFRRMPMKEVDWVPLTWKVLTIKTNRRVKKRVNSTIFSASRISIQSYLPCLKWTLLPFYLYLWKLLWKSPVNVSFCGKSAITKTWINN